MHCADVLFPVLAPADQVQFSLCNRTLLRKLPVSKLYFTAQSHARFSRIRKFVHLVPGEIYQGLTHLQMRGNLAVRQLASWSNMIHLEIESGPFDLVLPENLRTFIGHSIKILTIPLSLTHLNLTSPMTGVRGLDNHPNLTILKVTGNIYPKFTLPPNLVEFDMPTLLFAVTAFPQTLRVLRISPQNFLICSLPEKLEHLCLQGLWSNPSPKLPRGLCSLQLPDEGVYYMDTQEFVACTKLVKLVLPRKISEEAVQKMLVFSDKYLPNLSELQFSSCAANTRIKNLTFSNLKRLTIQTKGNFDETFQFQQRLGVTFLDLSFDTLDGECSIELPPRIRILKLVQTQMFGIIGYSITITLPESLRVLEVRSPQSRFYISVSREHLFRLDVIGDRGKAEENGRIVTSWGAFIIV